MSPIGQIDGKIEAEGEFSFSNQFWEKLEKTFSESPMFDDLEKILQEPEPLDWYSIRDFDLSTARNNERITDFSGEGDIVLVISYTGKAEIKFDSPNADSFDLETYKEIKHTYTDIFLSNEAQSEATIKVLFGRGDWGFTKRILEIDLHGTVPGGKLNLLTHLLTEGTWTDNSPAAGSVAWSGIKVIYRGITYTIADGSTNQAYIWWDFSLSTTTFQTSNTKPALTDDDFIVAYNDGGTHILIWNATLIDGRVLRTGSVTADELYITDLADIKNLLTIADLIKIGGTVLTGDRPGFVVSDGTYNRFEAGEIGDGIYGTNVRDVDGVLTVEKGEVTERWRKIYEITRSTACTFFTLDGFNGNLDLEYIIRTRFVRGGDTADMTYGLQLNEDAGNNYGYQAIRGVAASLLGTRFGAQTFMRVGKADDPGELSHGEFVLHAASGHVRTLLGSFSENVTPAELGGGNMEWDYWSNAADNITKMTFLSTAANGIGIGTQIEIWKRIF